MLKERKIQVLAEADGWTEVVIWPGWCSAKHPTKNIKYTWWHPEEFEKFMQRSEFPPYLTSRDAIIPLVVRWCRDDMFKWCSFFELLSMCTKWPSNQVVTTINKFIACFKAEPEQIADALIRAMGKWEDEQPDALGRRGKI